MVYSWKNGPEAITQHSVAKQRSLQAYLAEYFKILIGGRRNELKLTRVDGFAGGGLYYHEDN